jgi:oligoendopeptidase F
MTSALPKRADVPEQYTWDLTVVYPDNNAWEQDFASLPALLDEFESYQGRLGADAGTLLAAMRLQDRVEQTLYRLAVYSSLRRDEDTTDATYQALADRAQQLITRAGAAASFVRPELLALAEGTIAGFMEQEPDLRLYEHVFDDLLREKPHVLSAAEETLLAEAGEVAAAPRTAYGLLANADMTYGTVTDEDGATVELTQGRYTKFMRSPYRPLREESFNKLHATYTAHRNTCASLFAANVKGDLFYARARKYPSALEAALYGDNIPVSVYTNLITAVHENLPELHRYLRLRRQALGVDQLHMYDLHVPVAPETTSKVPYDEARQTVLAALAPLGAEYGAAAAKGLNSRWVDVYETPNKRSGAYSWGSYDTPPYMLLNYQDTLYDVFTLAHELGHSMHSYFTRQGQPFVYSNYTIFVAEVASTLNEALLTHYLLHNSDDPRVRLTVVNNNLDTIRGTLYRQTMFAEFEKMTHEAAEAGQALTADSLSEMYYALNQQYYGPDVVSDEPIAIEWARIPHFYNSFYVYKYATGIAASSALAQGIIREGAPAVERYLRFLSRGSSAYSIDLLRDAGVDMTAPDPVASALTGFGAIVDELERLLTETGALQGTPA